MRLIDADELIKILRVEACENAFKGYMDAYYFINRIIEDVEEQDTAYNIDKVVEQLEDRSTLSRPVGWTKSYEILTLKDAIEIVRGGEVS